MAARRFHSSSFGLSDVVKSYPEVHLFLGYGPRAQYKSVPKVMADLKPHVDAISARCANKPWAAVFGGDTAIESAPDLGMVMKSLHEQHNCHLIAVQSWQEFDDHIDAVYIHTPDFRPSRTKSGQIKEKEMFGGFANGKPVGATRHYLGDDMVGANGAKGLLTGVVALGGGAVAVAELQYAAEQGVPYKYIRSEAKNTEAYSSTYGPVEDWVSQQGTDVVE